MLACDASHRSAQARVFDNATGSAQSLCEGTCVFRPHRATQNFTLTVLTAIHSKNLQAKVERFALCLHSCLCSRVVPFMEITACAKATTGNNYAITKGLKDSNYERILSSVNPDRIRSRPIIACHKHFWISYPRHGWDRLAYYLRAEKNNIVLALLTGIPDAYVHIVRR
ncbi:unnamed protein product [Arctia plantaginis]|uniref:Uncharacterized protein n=1 Tax=Arctia plantaginis TaxID=874455 RepID=A0A8S0ZHN6_ARCPL|nr:unnamed protein product [Arctia plantaginis]CAB3249836.1 unnamed protein product [Arctia plantaginis]